ncbi:hypothetical protein QAD02_013708 [Eretmocerus hayati]|uniref:Uncharacterized protein n=1 Tax=Eretmocerus hayati TaxID=131215 RepID=A0ACC2P501_9HYME|nr:hypothetical protein QAD02_013708 [Eretmocerus hayati]
MGGWNIPPFMPPFLPPHVTSTASIREVRDSESERDQRATAGRSNDSSGDDAEYIRQQRDRLQNLRGSQTTNQVPSNPPAPSIAQTPVGPRTQETSQGAYAGETRQRPREDRREQQRRMGNGDTGVEEVPLQGQTSSFKGAEKVGANRTSNKDVRELENFVRRGTEGS